MSPLYLYAVLGAAPSAPLGGGLAGEPIRLLDCDGIVAAAGEVEEAPPLAPQSLRDHDAVVRRLAEAADAVLPARFGALAADEAELCERLVPAAGGLRQALARVAGREQMILRVYSSTSGGASAAPPRHPPPLEPAGPSASPARHPPPLEAAASTEEEGPGARYLAERARAQRAAAEIAEIAPLRPVLARFVAAERVERHDAPPARRERLPPAPAGERGRLHRRRGGGRREALRCPRDRERAVGPVRLRAGGARMTTDGGGRHGHDH